MGRILARGGMLAAVAALGACAARGPGPDEVSRASRGVDAAADVGARAHAQAARYLDISSRELARARRQLGAGDTQGARSWARRAIADAEVARMLAVEAATLGAAKRTEEDAEHLSRALDAGLVGERVPTEASPSATGARSASGAAR